MAENQSKNVGVVLINNLGLYSSKYFIPLRKLLGRTEDVSFLIINVHYFNSCCRDMAPPKQPFDNNWRPPEYGKPLFLIKEKKVPEKLAKLYQEVYSLDGKFGKIADKCYICAPDIDKICQYLTSANPIIQKHAEQILQRDKVVIDLTYAALEVEEDIKDPKLREETIKKIMHTASDAMRGVPLDYKFNLSPIITDRNERLKYAQNSEQKYAEIMQTEVQKVFEIGKNFLIHPQTR